jgi:YgiT-type zinc finger domain-containing protein
MTDNDNNQCAICGSKLVSKKIEYIDRSEDHFLIVRDVPVQECEENGHQFFHAGVAKQIEKLFELDRQQALEPVEVISVPVVELDQIP